MVNKIVQNIKNLKNGTLLLPDTKTSKVMPQRLQF